MSQQDARLPLCGIFIGGNSTRMGGYPKGLLPDPVTGQPLVLRLLGLAEGAGFPCVLIGKRAEYATLGRPMLADCPSGVGPLGGLSALLQAIGERPGALALSCDLPHLSGELLRRLASPLLAAEPSDWDVLAPRRQGRWEPLCACYKGSVLPVLEQALAAEERSFQQLYRRLRVAPLPLLAAEHRELDDWDEPGEVPAELRPHS
jgi:molybdopterin-guanine dinucleotide biosynthesis protein A